MPDRYSKIRTIKNENGRVYRSNAVYPEIPADERDIYIITTIGDRLDSIAQQYYGDSTLWWIILAANNSINRASIVPEPGIQIRIPYSKQEVIDSFNNLNRTR